MDEKVNVREKNVRRRRGVFAKIGGWKTWQKVLAGVGAFLLVVIIGIGIFAWTQIAKVNGFIEDNFGTVETAAPVEDIDTEPFIMYISGIDDRDGNLPEKSRSDLNILAVVNPAKKKIMLVNVPRDYYVNLHGLDAKDKLTHAGDIGGLELSKTTIEDLLDVKVNYATRVNFNLLEGLVDAIGGVTVSSDIGKTFPLYWDKSCVIHDGDNDLDGRCAVAFARERLAYGEGDLHRAQNQEAVISAIFEKISKDKTVLLNYGAILDSLNGNFETSLSAEEVKELVGYVGKNAEGWKISEENLEVAGSGQEYGYLYPNERKFVFYVDENSVQNIHDKIVKFME